VYNEKKTQISTGKKNILHTILPVISFLFSERRDVKTQKSRLKYEIKFDLCYK